MTLSKLLDGYVDENFPLRATTVANHRKAVDLIRLVLGREPKVDDLNYETRDAVVTHLKGRRANYVNWLALQTLQVLWWHAVRSGLIAEPPVHVTLEDQGNTTPPWSKAELAKLVRATEKTRGMVGDCPARLWWSALHALLYDTQLQVGLVVACRSRPEDRSNGLAWEDVDLPALTITVRRRLGVRRCELGEHRIDVSTAELLERMRPTSGPALVFPGERNSFHRAHGRILDRAGLKPERPSRFLRLRGDAPSLGVGRGPRRPRGGRCGVADELPGEACRSEGLHDQYGQAARLRSRPVRRVPAAARGDRRPDGRAARTVRSLAYRERRCAAIGEERAEGAKDAGAGGGGSGVRGLGYRACRRAVRAAISRTGDPSMSIASGDGSGTISTGTSNSSNGGPGEDMPAVKSPLATSEAIEAAVPVKGRPMLHEAPGGTVANPARFSSSILAGVLVSTPKERADAPSSSRTNRWAESTTSLMETQSVGDRHPVAQSNLYCSKVAGRDVWLSNSTSPSSCTCQTNGTSAPSLRAARNTHKTTAAASRFIGGLSRGRCRGSDQDRWGGSRFRVIANREPGSNATNREHLRIRRPTPPRRRRGPYSP